MSDSTETRTTQPDAAVGAAHTTVDLGGESGGPAADPLGRALEDARRELLDLTTRNRLIDTRRSRKRSSSIEIVNELATEVFRILVTDEKAMTFLPREEPDENPDEPAANEPSNESADDDVTRQDSTAHIPPDGNVVSMSPKSRTTTDPSHAAAAMPGADHHAEDELDAPKGASFVAEDFDTEQPLFDLPQPDGTDEPTDTTESAADTGDDGEPAEPLPQHVDRHLQTDLSSNILQSRLLRQFYDARTYQEEQGVSILFLAVGFIQWFEADEPRRARHAPLILIPVELDRTSARSRFRIRWTGEDISTNLSWQVKLKADFGVDLPDVPPTEDLDIASYFEAVRAKIEHLDGWQVLADDMVLWFFSFAKLLMYRDLDPVNWPAEKQLTDRPLVRALLESGFAPEAPLCEDEAFVDDVIAPAEMQHIMDADGSQAIAIEEAKRGRDLIIQGPPGTGKSQTITNIIAAAVCAGKKVLFVAEKVAALEVVKRRLTNVGLGDMCLELHSNKAKKRELVEELARTLSLNKPICDDAQAVIDQLTESRDLLNTHCAAMHDVDEPSGLTPFRVLGELIRLRDEGVPPTDFDLADSERWSAGDVRTREALLEELASFVREIGPPNEHPWRGVMLDASLPNDRVRFQQSLPEVVSTIDALRETAAALAQHLDAEPALTINESTQLCAQAMRFADAPPMDRAAMADSAWAQHRGDITCTIEQGTLFAARHAELESKVIDAAWDTDWTETRLDISSFGRSLFRFLSGPYRRAMKRLKAVMRSGTVPNSVDDRLALLDGLIEARKARDTVVAASDLGGRAFGSMWNGDQSDFAALAAIDTWVRQCAADENMPGDFRERLQHLPDTAVLCESAAATISASDRALKSIREAFESIALDVDHAFGDDVGRSILDAAEAPLPSTVDRIRAWQEDPESIARWIAYRQRDDRARELGLSPLCDRLHDGRLSPGNARPRFRMTYFEVMLRRLVKLRPELGSFDGLAHERVRDRFRTLDDRRIELARQQTALSHFERIPRGVSEIGEIGLIRREAKKRRRHLPIRQLLREAGNAITEIKPVVMMSPLSIAQYVEPGALEFDVLIFDEASQVRPVDALGAAARAKQIIVVGDDRQLPPTQFFSRSVDDMEDDADLMEQRAGDLESILGLCHAQNVPRRMLRWHYRSRHQSLIAVSNHEFYEDKLNVVPSPVRAGGELGVRFHHLPHAVYDRGGSATNADEARAVAEAVMMHAEQSPDVTLGVGAFSIKQRDAIIDELERLRRSRPDLESFFTLDGPEPFFVKNLENIQGDERDVIFISVGFGRDADGNMTMNFGPLSNEGGERRLNVLITRARSRCEMFSSITADDIDLNRAGGFGPRAFKAYLQFAQRGAMQREHDRDGEADSVFEQQIADALRQLGHEVDARIGDSGFFVDLAIRDAADPSQYLLGIETDGRGYRAARWARDRDRIHPSVLSFRGWTVHRLWVTDWFSRPQEQLDALLDAIEQAKHKPPPIAGASGAKRDAAIEREGGAAEEACTISTPYKEAGFRVPKRTEIHEMSVERLGDFVHRVVEIEQPIHRDEVAQRITSLWGQSRTGKRISQAVDAAIAHLVRTHAIVTTDDFVQLAEAGEPPVRSRAKVESRTLRRIEMIAPAEIRRCLELLIEHHLGVTRDEAAVATTRELGFKLTSAPMREAIDAQIDALIQIGAVLEDGGRLRLTPDAEVHSTPPESSVQAAE